MNMRTALDEIRREIDSLDKQMHNLLLKRVDLVSKIGKEKKKTKAPIVQPSREAALVRKILSANKKPLHDQTVFKIWREIIATCSLQQDDSLKIAVVINENDVYTSVQMMEMTNDYFGSVLPIKYVGDVQTGLSALREGDASFAVLPWPEDMSSDQDQNVMPPWWMTLIRDYGLEHTPQVYGRLPFQDKTDLNSAYHPQAAILSSFPFSDSGDDRSLIVLSLNEAVSRGWLVDKLKAQSVQVNSILSYADPITGKLFYLIDVNGFITDEDDRFASILASFDQEDAELYCLGGYPVPPQWG